MSLLKKKRSRRLLFFVVLLLAIGAGLLIWLTNKTPVYLNYQGPIFSLVNLQEEEITVSRMLQLDVSEHAAGSGAGTRAKITGTDRYVLSNPQEQPVTLRLVYPYVSRGMTLDELPQVFVNGEAISAATEVAALLSKYVWHTYHVPNELSVYQAA